MVEWVGGWGSGTKERERRRKEGGKRDASLNLSFSFSFSSQIQAAERKKPQKERDLVAKYKVFAKLQTAEDHEVFIHGLLCGFFSFSFSSF